jgi:hypothetical protein
MMAGGLNIRGDDESYGQCKTLKLKSKDCAEPLRSCQLNEVGGDVGATKTPEALMRIVPLVMLIRGTHGTLFNGEAQRRKS